MQLMCYKTDVVMLHLCLTSMISRKEKRMGQIITIKYDQICLEITCHKAIVPGALTN
jgi:hypothetical protein